jgi:hypothetical protein
MAGLALVKNRFAGFRVRGICRDWYGGDHGNRQNPLAHPELPSRFALSNANQTRNS